MWLGSIKCGCRETDNTGEFLGVLGKMGNEIKMQEKMEGKDCIYRERDKSIKSMVGFMLSSPPLLSYEMWF